jgi:hypothetical protein
MTYNKKSASFSSCPFCLIIMIISSFKGDTSIALPSIPRYESKLI